jgi:hypothetical protein
MIADRRAQRRDAEANLLFRVEHVPHRLVAFVTAEQDVLDPIQIGQADRADCNFGHAVFERGFARGTQLGGQVREELPGHREPACFQYFAELALGWGFLDLAGEERRLGVANLPVGAAFDHVKSAGSVETAGGMHRLKVRLRDHRIDIGWCRAREDVED